jgi:hypothetical protein
MILGCMYVPPHSNSNYFERMLDEFSNIFELSHPTIVAGDLSLDYKYNEDLCKKQHTSY